MKRTLQIGAALLLIAAGRVESRPNILLIITDDQGYGDLGLHGNKDIRTPHIDALGAQSSRIEPFLVCPVCSPTRSSLLTGRYNYRTGIVDTFLGRSMMHPDEVTLAEMLGGAGYRTGIFGKWHLGDNYPLRPQDQGFQECLTICGGGLGQSSDPPGGDHYQDPTLYRNGVATRTKGYCSDLYTDGALQFIEASKDRPFFAYVAYNAPHTPLEAPEGYLKPYLEAKLPEVTAKVYAMVQNIDDNVGRLMAKLDELKLADNTIVIFMTDNGPQQARYNAGMRGLKTSCYEGGIHVPFFLRWPAALKPRKVDAPFAHIDVVPTLLEATGAAAPAGVKLDGRSFLPWLKEEKPAPERTLFFQWHRGDEPEKFRGCAARGTRWKAVWSKPDAKPELFDLNEGEKENVAEKHADIVDRLTKEYDAWYEDMKATRHFAPPRIVLDPGHENPILLSRQNWRERKGGGAWLVEVPNELRLHVKVWFKAPGVKCALSYRCGETSTDVEVEADATTASLPAVPHPAGKAEISATLHAKTPYGVEHVELTPAR